MSPPRIEEASAAPSVDVASLLWPGEHPRFVLAATVAIASALFLVGILLVEGVVRFLIIALTLGAAVGSVWWVLQIGKARLLGSSIKVTSTSFPDLQAVIDDVRRQLDYHRRIDVYVVAKSDPAVNLISYLGTRVIIIEGGLAEELSEPARQAQLCFLIARHIGALKARHTRVDALVVLLSAANALPYAKPFLLPYYRATTYSGDQIGLTCCGSLDAALEATGRLLVGKELAADLPMGGVLTQASMIQKRWLPRLAQFTSPSPHVVNRYLNLLMYGRRLYPESWDRVRA
ncbi:MAG: hypothetical protein QOD61_243, partial [Solirubrobacteraceae bacterium]|nr:hypothetical protein [Solirubrobacteraceae bacterium]